MGRIITIAIYVNVTLCECDERILPLPPPPLNALQSTSHSHCTTTHSPTDRYPVLAHRFVVQQYLYSSVIEIDVQGIGREMQMPSCHCH